MKRMGYIVRFMKPDVLKVTDAWEQNSRTASAPATAAMALCTSSMIYLS